MVATLRPWGATDFASGIDRIIHKLDGTTYAGSPAFITPSTMDDAGLCPCVVHHTLRHAAATDLSDSFGPG